MKRPGLFIVILLSALLLGGLWWALQPEASAVPARVTLGDSDLAPGLEGRAGTPGPAAAGAGESNQSEYASAKGTEPRGSGEIVRPDLPPSGANAGNPGPAGQPGTDPGKQGNPSSPVAPGGSGPVTPATPQPGAQSETTPPAPTLPTPARVPTPRERAEQARYAGGAKLPKAEAIPRVVSNAEIELPPLDMTKLAEPEIWAEYWAREGYAAPAMINTPVRGKLMARLAQSGIEGATVRLFTFFPATSQLGGPVLPVVMEATSDAQGFFNSNLPVPDKWPTGYAKLALSIEAEKLRLVDALLVPDLRPGEANEIGVFWAPEEPYEVEVKVTAARTGLAVAATGRIDPRRWEAKRAAKMFAYFNKVSVGASGAKLQGTWDILADAPFVTLLENGAPVLTQQAARKPEAPPTTGGGQAPAEPLVGAPFEPVVFANDGYMALTGRVIGPEDQPVAGAIITLTGDGDPRVTYSDASGFFVFGGLRDLKVQLRAEHGEFVAADSGLVPSTSSELVLRLQLRKLRLTLNVTRQDNGQVVPMVWFEFWLVEDLFADELDLRKEHRRSNSPAGTHRVEHDQYVVLLYIMAPGLKPVLLSETLTEEEQEWYRKGGEQAFSVKLEPGLPLSRRPRDYDTASWPEGWHTEGETPCLWSLDDDHWVEYKFNFGETEVDFALELGVKNHSYGTLPLDNEYLFEVEVSLDGQKVATLSIPSDAQVPRYVLQQLGTLKGEHTIRLKWLNDRYIPGQLDANISYESIELFETAP